MLFLPRRGCSLRGGRKEAGGMRQEGGRRKEAGGRTQEEGGRKETGLLSPQEGYSLLLRTAELNVITELNN